MAIAPAERPKRVLLVDDDSASRIGMCKLLELDDISVAVAPDGPAALAYLAASDVPDLVLLDIGLPEMDGYETCRRMRAMPGGAVLNIFALTGFGQESDRIATGKAGFDAHLVKPVDVDDVYAQYTRHLRKRAGLIA